MTKTLPRVMSQLIDIALRDLEACEKDKTYIVSMGGWHHPTVVGHCAVCLAGAVMAQTLEVSPLTDTCPSDCKLNMDQLLAIDLLREGAVRSAASKLGIRHVAVAARCITHYSDDPDAFKRDMRELADELRRVCG